MINRYRWKRLLAPTTGLRRSLAAALAGLFMFGIGFVLSFKAVLEPYVEVVGQRWNGLMSRFVTTQDLAQSNHYVGGALIALGLYLLVVGARGVLRRFYETLSPTSAGSKAKMVNVFVQRQQLSQGPRIVALGGGTGLSTLLRGLKRHSSNITAVVTVTDDGGSSGRLVHELGIIPPGDIRNCLVALADAEKLMTDLFQHRFKNASGSLSGHSLGNLLIAGLIDQTGGDLERAINIASEVLNIRGRVLPSTLSHIRLKAIMDTGEELYGETTIVSSGKRIRRIQIEPADAEPFRDVLAAIADADLICIGPGSVYTSVVPNLLVPGIAQAIHESDAIKAYICNVMTQPGESDSFTAAEHILSIQANVEPRVFDYVMVNSGMPSSATIEKYEGSGQYVVEADIERIRAMGFRVVPGNFMSEMDYVRHDPVKVAQRLMDLLHR